MFRSAALQLRRDHFRLLLVGEGELAAEELLPEDLREPQAWPAHVVPA